MIRCNVREKVAAFEETSTHPAPEFLPQDRLEQCVHHVEHVRLIDNVNVLNSDRHGVLQPIDYPLRDRRGELPSLLKSEPVHIEDNHNAGDLRDWLQHGRLHQENTAFEYLVQAALVVLPPFPDFDHHHPSPVLVPDW